MQSVGFSTPQQAPLPTAWSPAHLQKACPTCIRPLARRSLVNVHAAAAQETSEQKIRIKLKAYELPLLKQSVKEILRAADGTGGWQQHIARSLKVLVSPCLHVCQLRCYVTLACAAEADVSGPVPLPTRIRKYTVLRSPHVNKDSREQFEVRTHQRLIDIRDPSAATIDSLMGLDLPAGVDVQVKLQ